MGPGISPTNNRRTPLQRQTVTKPKSKREIEKSEKGKTGRTEEPERQAALSKKGETEKAVGRLDTSVFEAFEPAHRSSVDLSKEAVCRGAPGVKCGLPVGHQDEGVECDICQCWFHAGCQDIPTEAYEALQEHIEVLAWICKTCRSRKHKGCASTGADLSRLEEKIDKLTETVNDQSRIIKKTAVEKEQAIRQLGEFQGRNISTLQEQNETILQHIEEVKNAEKKKTEAGRTYADVAKNTYEKIIDTLEAKLDTLPKADKLVELETKVVEKIKEQQKVIKDNTEGIKKVIQSKEQEDRVTNVLIHNLPESEAEESEERKKDDIKKFTEIAEALGVQNFQVLKIIRLRQKTESVINNAPEQENGSNPSEKRKEKTRPRILLLRLGSREHVEVLYNRRFDLKRKGIENIYITKDLPPEEREKQRKLREEWNRKGRETHVISRGRVVERKGNKQAK